MNKKIKRYCNILIKLPYFENKKGIEHLAH